MGNIYSDAEVAVPTVGSAVPGAEVGRRGVSDIVAGDIVAGGAAADASAVHGAVVASRAADLPSEDAPVNTATVGTVPVDTVPVEVFPLAPAAYADAIVGDTPRSATAPQNVTVTPASTTTDPDNGFVSMEDRMAAMVASPTVDSSAGTPGNVDRVDPVKELKKRVKDKLQSKMGARMTDDSVTDDELHTQVGTEMRAILAAEQTALTATEREALAVELVAETVGLGPLEKLLADDDISEVMVNGPDRVYIELKGKLTLSSTTFEDETQLRETIDRIVAKIGRRIDESSPMVDARLKDGSRVNAVIPPLAVSGSTLTIRKFRKEPLTVEHLIGFNSMSRELAHFLDACVKGRLNILVSGGTGSGKTTLLNVLSSFIPVGERIITVEDAVELQLQQDHIVQLETKAPNTEGKGEVTIRDLIRNTLRMRPDRIVVGEVRAGEALDMLQAMNTGHDGSLSTIHSNSARDCIARLETLVMMAGMDLPHRAIREQIASAVDMIVQIGRLKDGSRRVIQVAEVEQMEGDVVTMQDIFRFNYDAGMDEYGKYVGGVEPTGVRPRFMEKLEDHGIRLPPSVFGAHASAQAW